MLPAWVLECVRWPHILSVDGWRRAVGMAAQSMATEIEDLLHRAENWQHHIPWQDFYSAFDQRDRRGLDEFYSTHLSTGVQLLTALKSKAEDEKPRLRAIPLAGGKAELAAVTLARQAHNAAQRLGNLKARFRAHSETNACSHHLGGGPSLPWRR